MEINVTATVNGVFDNFVGTHDIGDTISGSFIFDTDEANASSAQTTPSTNPGHEFTSFYEFPSPPYSVSLSFPDVPGSFSNAAPVGVVVNNDLPLLSADLNGFLPDGNYDWIEILGSTASDFCPPAGPCTPADGEEWTLAIFGDTSWFSDGSVIPDSLPASFRALIVGIEVDPVGNETGVVFAPVDTLRLDGVLQNGSVTNTIPEPAALALFAFGLAGLGFARRRKAAA